MRGRSCSPIWPASASICSGAGLRHAHQERKPRIVEPLGLVGGFLDAAGGGGWGPVVTSNLLVQGAQPRKVIGTVNTAEFFLSVTISATFLVSLGAEAFTVGDGRPADRRPRGGAARRLCRPSGCRPAPC